MTITELLDKLERVAKNGSGWTARCPAHEDKNPSLSITEGEAGILLYCHGGCTTEAVVAALGWTMRDLSKNGSNGSGSAKADAKPAPARFEGTERDVEDMQIAFVKSAEARAYVERRGISLRVAADLKFGFSEAWNFAAGPKPALMIPHYVDGRLVGIKARTISGAKEFAQVRGSSAAGLYAADALDPAAEDVLVVEGPEDAALLISHGFNATAINSAGAKLGDADLRRLRAYKRIFLVGDQDRVGQQAMLALEGRLPPEQAIRVRIRGHKDVGEMYAANPAKFAANLRAVLRWARASREMFDLDDLLTETEIRAGLVGVEPDEVEKLVPRNSITMIFAPEKSGKSLLATYFGKCVANGRPVFGKYAATKAPVLYLDLENSAADIESFTAHFARLGPEPVRYRTRATGCPDLGSPGLVRFCERYKPLLIFDSLTKFLRGADPFNPAEMSELFDKLLDLCAAGATVILIHHATRDDAERYANSHQIGANVARAFAVVSEDRPRLERVRLEAKLYRGAEPVSEDLIAFPVIAERGEFGLASAPADPDVDRVVALIAARGRLTPAQIKGTRDEGGAGMKRERAVDAIARALRAGLLAEDLEGFLTVPK